MSDSTIELFETLASVLLYCWLFGYALLLLWFGIYRLAGGFVHRLHGGLFGLSKHELDVIFYCGMGLLKLGVILLFFFPWLAIRLVL
jgi:hypothetical protein